MESNNQKILTVSYVILGVLAALVVQVLFETLSAASGVVARLGSNDFVRHGVPVFVGIVVFALLQLNAKVNAWGGEVVVELKKIVWPSRKDTFAMTLVVCIMLLISGIVIGGFDVLSAYIVDLIVG